MGCFDSTCSVSHNPICEGDDTVVLFVGADIKPIYGKITYEATTFPQLEETNTIFPEAKQCY